MNLAEQKQLILSGAMYNDLTPELISARQHAVVLTNQYNQSLGQSASQRQLILQKLLGSIGDDGYFEPNFRCE